MKLKFPIFHAPDNGTNVAVPAESSPTGAQVDVTPRSAPPAPEIHQPEPIEKPTRQSGVKTSKVDVAKELGMEKPPSDYINEEAQRVRDEKGRFKKPDPELFKNGSPTDKPAAEPAQLGDPKPVKEKKPAKAPEPPAPAPVAKVKIGDKEMTPEEIQAELKTLREKAEAAAKPPEAPKPAEPPKPAAPEKTIEELRQAYIQSQIDRQDDILDEKFADKILAGGPDAVKAWRQVRAMDKAELREHMTAEVNRVLQGYDERLTALDGMVKPVAEGWQQNTAQQNADKFLNSNQDIKSHPQGYEMMVDRSARLNREYAALTRLMKEASGDDFVDEYAERLKEISGDNFFSTLALEVRAKLGLGAPAPAPPAAVAPPVAAPPTPAPVAQPKALRPPPQGGTLGVTGTPKKTGDQAGQVAELMNSSRW